MNTNPTFSRIASRIRESLMPAEMKNKLLLLFYRIRPEDQGQIQAVLEKNPEALPIFAEFITELEQSDTNTNDTTAVKTLLEKYIEKLK
ncbi:MAG: hypothetical protein NTY66_01675 [Candidatus Vogelbacteria bacterium]|nr:hypothetical protein [Candidatus Vogelbacteria bacterium]